MIAHKGQLVTLVNATDVARVVAIVYPDQPEGQRGVQLDRQLGGSRWWCESDLIPATPAYDA